MVTVNASVFDAAGSIDETFTGENAMEEARAWVKQIQSQYGYDKCISIKPLAEITVSNEPSSF